MSEPSMEPCCSNVMGGSYIIGKPIYAGDFIDTQGRLWRSNKHQIRLDDTIQTLDHTHPIVIHPDIFDPHCHQYALTINGQIINISNNSVIECPGIVKKFVIFSSRLFIHTIDDRLFYRYNDLSEFILLTDDIKYLISAFHSRDEFVMVLFLDKLGQWVQIDEERPELLTYHGTVTSKVIKITMRRVLTEDNIYSFTSDHEGKLTIIHYPIPENIIDMTELIGKDSNEILLDSEGNIYSARSKVSDRYYIEYVQCDNKSLGKIIGLTNIVGHGDEYCAGLINSDREVILINKKFFTLPVNFPGHLLVDKPTNMKNSRTINY